MCNTYSLILNCRNKTVKLILKNGYNFLYLNLCSSLNVVCFCFVAIVVVVIANTHTKKCIQFFGTEMYIAQNSLAVVKNGMSLFGVCKLWMD